MFETQQDLSPLGYYNIAVSFLDAADIILEAKHLIFEAPVRTLYAHAWELTLKACLRVQGESVENLRRKFGHDLAKAYARVDLQRFEELKLASASFLIDQLNPYHRERLHFYPKSGPFTVIAIEEVRDKSRNLRIDRRAACRLFSGEP